MRTKTHDISGYGVEHMSGLLRLEEKRNMAHITAADAKALKTARIDDGIDANKRLRAMISL